MNHQNKNFILEKNQPAFYYVEFLMMGFLAIIYLKLWVSPGSNDGEKLHQFAILMAFEFVMVHSGLMMAVLSKKLTLLLIIPFYGVFVWGFNKMVGSNHLIIYIYLVAVLNRMRYAFFDVDPVTREKIVMKSFFAVMTYFFLTLFVALGNSIIPDFGLTEKNLERIGYMNYKLPGGLFTDKPQTAMCLGFLYYSAMAWYAYPKRKQKIN